MESGGSCSFTAWFDRIWMLKMDGEHTKKLPVRQLWGTGSFFEILPAAVLFVVVHFAVEITVILDVFIEKFFKKIYHNNYPPVCEIKVVSFFSSVLLCFSSVLLCFLFALYCFVSCLYCFVSYLYFFVTSCILTEKHLWFVSNRIEKQPNLAVICFCRTFLEKGTFAVQQTQDPRGRRPLPFYCRLRKKAGGKRRLVILLKKHMLRGIMEKWANMTGTGKMPWSGSLRRAAA